MVGLHFSFQEITPHNWHVNIYISVVDTLLDGGSIMEVESDLDEGAGTLK